MGLFSPTVGRIGGAEWITLNMAYALNTKGHEVLICSADRISPSQIRDFVGRDLHFKAVKFGPTLFEPYSLENIYPNLLRTYLFSLKCGFMVDTFSNDILPWTDAIYFHGVPRSLRLPKGTKGILFSPYKALVTSAIKRKKTGKQVLMTCSEHNARIIREYAGLRVNVLYPPVSDFFKTRNNAVPARSDTVVTVVRISDDKRPETIPQIAKLVENMSFIIIGNCKLPQEMLILRRLQKSIKDLGVEGKVKVLLNVSREEQREVLQRSKIYLHPQVPYESFGISVVEAMSAGCVPIVPDVGGLKEIVPEERRYATLEEAAALVEKSMVSWSQRKTQESAAATDMFSQAKFNEEFVKIMSSAA